MSELINEFSECRKEVERKFGGKTNVRSFVCSGQSELLESINNLYAELVHERVAWYNLELSQDCFGLGWDGEGYGYE